jgi:hypothetical protein
MEPAQIPGSLFLILMAIAAWLNQDPDVIFLLALSAACGWLAYNPLVYVFGWFGSVLFAIAGASLLFTRIYL